MDALNRARRPLRNELKKLWNEAKDLIEGPIDKDAVRVQYRLLLDAFSSLSELDQKVMEQLVTENATEEQQDEEYSAIQEYKKRTEMIRLKLEDLLAVPPPPESSDNGSSTGMDVDGTGLRLPKYQFRKFSGKLLDWLGFWAQFQKVDSHPKLTGSDKFGYLLMSLEEKSEAYELVSAFPQSNENYTEAIGALKRRFGNEDLLLQVYIRELLKLVISNASRQEKLPFSSLFTKVDSHLRALKTLNLAQADPATWLYPLVESCLPDDILLTWQRSPMAGGEDSSADGTMKTRLDLLMGFLEREVDIRQRMGIARQGFEDSTASNDRKRKTTDTPATDPKALFGKKQRKQEHVPTLTGFQNLDSASTACIFCNKKGHRATDCISARKMTFEDRKKIAATHRLCFFCLGKHFARSCKSTMRCLICTGRHCNAMCKQLECLSAPVAKRLPRKEDTAPRANLASNNSNKEVVQFQGHSTQNFSNHVTSSHVALQTLQVILLHGERKKLARVFLDSGSQRSYITKSTANQLGLKEKGTEVVTHELFGGRRTRRLVHKKYDVTMKRMDSEFICDLEVRDQEKISSFIPTVSLSTELPLPELQRMGVVFSDVGEGTPPIDILIGADYYGLLLTGNIQTLSNGQVAVETKLGWTLIGGRGTIMQEDQTCTSMTVSDYSITQLWDLDTIGVRDNTDVKKQQDVELEAKQKFLKEIVRDETGRYVVKLPWKDCHPPLPDNKNVALKRLHATTRKLKESGLFGVYDKLFRDWEHEDFIEEVKHEDLNRGVRVHYIPHRAVVKPSSLTTPVRPVFDASCKVGRNASLNDCLHKGTNYIQLIPEVLLRFREKRIGFTSDIRKAFQMIGVDSTDRDVMRFLWWDDQKEIKVYRHKRVMFGATCSPFILGAVLFFHLTNLPEYQDVGEKLLRSLYVDNSVGSEDSVEQYQYFRKISTALLSDCKMDLRMWLSNIDEFDDEATHTVSVLGLQWDRLTDELFVNVSDINVPDKVTKRTVLATAHKIFDPIGYTCPALIPLKALLQRMWIQRLKWDEALPEEETQIFLKLLMQLPMLGSIRIPRWIVDPDCVNGSMSLHTFADASKLSYASATFLRVVKGKKISIQLLAAKARVAPVKQVTMPRLELLGCLIGARLCASVKSSLALKDIQEFYWTDSSTALAWIRQNEQWGTFVGNRTAEINNLTRREDWYHVPGNKNPADFPSRGASPSALSESKWWLGPSWLYETENPGWTVDVNQEEVNKERKKSCLSSEKYISMTIFNVSNKERSFESMVRIVGWMKRFLHNCKSNNKQNGPLTTVEKSEAELSLIYGIQQEEFGDDLARFKGLDVFRDHRGLLYVKTRIIRRTDIIESNTPLVLPGKHPLVRQLIWDYHKSYCHAGVGFLLIKLRRKYWILKARKSIKYVVSKCVRCRRLSVKPTIAETAPLPLNRIKDADVYEVVGVDLAGPLYLRNNKKVWIVIITCAVYRAVYLDLVDSVSTKSFIKCLEKFIDRHRRPEIIYSDNGTNFRGADNLFRSLDWTSIRKDEQIEPIKWIFNPPGGPWWGGYWERLIRIVKDLLKRSVGKASLTRKELMETLKVIQNVMNDRPLTYVTECNDDLEPLTPNMFMRPSGTCKFPEGLLMEGEKLRIRYNYMRTLWKELKDRFQKEYLSMLVSRSRKKPTRLLKEGELVVVGSDQKRRMDWPLARIIELIPGSDGVVRVAKIKMADGEYLRPVQRLHPLEVDGESKMGHCMQTRSKSRL